jgi:AraC-like DNA-binding protein
MNVQVRGLTPLLRPGGITARQAEDTVPGGCVCRHRDLRSVQAHLPPLPHAGDHRPRRPGDRWAALAADLGYADQGHFIRDFKTMFGEPPTWYAQRY